MLQNNLPWPAWTVALAPDYTLFMPVTVRSASAYQNNIPPLAAAATQNAPGTVTLFIYPYLLFYLTELHLDSKRSLPSTSTFFSFHTINT